MLVEIIVAKKKLNEMFSFLHVHLPKFPFLGEKQEDKQKYRLKGKIELFLFINKSLQTNKNIVT